ncbi:ABC transporter substrate-binding protein [Desulfovibrio inopinatus]|uniref:ABC transporter substrate-binding protein n=1 Tax=Desulfovibrio inopinatus TaxID=102109 RepID=UPI0004097788|nr:ABC transporter substrate-binding protein [Desulfovibrio inopinatus]
MYRFIALCLTMWLLCCTSLSYAQDQQKDPFKDSSFAQIEEAAKGTTVAFYMFGGFADVNKWIDGYVAKELKSRYNITLKRIPMDAAVFVSKLLTEKTAGKKNGVIDLLWVNGENFKNAMEAGLLYGPFAERLPNFRYVDPNSVRFDFGYPVRGFEAPYGRAQFVFEYDSAQIPNPPKTYAALAQWIIQNPGRFTYPQPPDFTGSAFIRQVFYAVSGGFEQYMRGYDKSLYEKKAPLLWTYLNLIKPALWQEGRSYPKDSAALDTLFGRGEIDFGMSYHPAHAQSKILDGDYPKTVRTCVMDDGSIFNTHFTAIPDTAPNKAGAMVVANFLLSPEAQLDKFDPKHWGDYPAIDIAKLPQDWQEKFSDVDLGAATMTPEALAAKGVPEIPAGYVEPLEEGWNEHVLHQE